MKKYYIPILSIFLLFSCEELLEVVDISKEEVTLLAPTESSVVKGNVVSFNWNHIEEATGYVLQLATPNFQNASQILLNTTVTITQFQKELLPNNYQWRVKAINSDYETPFKTHSFSVIKSDEFSGATVILNSPQDNFATKTTDITLSWQAVDDATDYRVLVEDSQANVIFDESTTSTTIDLTFDEGSYTWKVRAQNETESTLYSQRNLLIDTTIPNTPELSSPSDNHSQSNTTVDFSWNRNDIAGSQERDSIYLYSDASLTTLISKALSTNKQHQATLETNTYYWRVKAFDAAGNTSSYSTSRKLTIN